MSENKKTFNKKKIISVSVTVFLVITVCFCLFVAIQVLSRGYASIGNKSFFRVITGSMEPSVSVGELIVTNNVDIEEIEVKDVICFTSRSPDMLGAVITHRVVDKGVGPSGEILLVTKGDANLSIDAQYVTAENFIGKMVWSSGDSGIATILSFLSGGYGFLVCIVFPAVLILTIIMREIVRSMKRDMESLVREIEDTEPQSDDPEKVSISEEEFDQMRERIRKELMEEINNSDDSEQSR